jgi:hypothetical protein
MIYLRYFNKLLKKLIQPNKGNLMNKLIVATIIIGTISNAHAGFGDFASKMTQNVIGTSASSNVNVTDFLTQASATNLLFKKAVQL